MVLVEFVEVVSYPEVGLGLGFGVCNDRHLVAIVLSVLYTTGGVITQPCVVPVLIIGDHSGSMLG